MLSTNRTNKLHKINRRVGSKRLDIGLDPIARQQLDELVTTSGYGKGEKGGRIGVLTYAIDYLFRKCVNREKAMAKLTLTKR